MTNSKNIIINKLKKDLLSEKSKEDYLTRIENKLSEYDIDDISIKASLVEHYLAEEILNIQEDLKSYDFESARHKTTKMFNKFQSRYGIRGSNRDELTNLFNHINILSDNEKDIFMSISKFHYSVSNYLITKIRGINNILELNKEDLDEEIKTFVFSPELDRILKKQSILNEEKANFYVFFDYVRKEVLPYMKHENIAKFYLYTLSGNFFNDLKDPEFSKMFLNNSKEEVAALLQIKIKKHQIPMFLENKDKSNDYNAKIKLKSFSLRYMLNDNQSTPSGYIDFAIQDFMNPKKIYVAHIKASTMENDIYKHDESSLIVDRALKNWASLNDVELITFDSQKGHKIENFLSSSIDKNDNDFKDIKQILDTVINKLVYKYNNYEKEIIQPGDTKYSLESLKKQSAYETFILLCENIHNGNLDVTKANGSTLKIFSRSMDWIEYNLLNDPEFLSNSSLVENLKKSIVKTFNKFENSRLVTDKIFRLLNELDETHLNKLFNKVSINKYYKEVLSKKGYYDILAPSDFISVSDNFKIDKFKDKLFKSLTPVVDSFIKLEKANRINATKMERIYLKYNAYHTEQYEPNKIDIKIIDDNGKITTNKKYFSQKAEFEPITAYQKHIVSLFDITINRDANFNIEYVKNSLSNLCSKLENRSYFEEFNSQKRSVRNELYNVKMSLSNKVLENIKGLINELEVDIEPIINKANLDYNKHVPNEISKLSDLKDKVSEFNLNSLIKTVDMDEFESLKKELYQDKKSPSIKYRV